MLLFLLFVFGTIVCEDKFVCIYTGKELCVNVLLCQTHDHFWHTLKHTPKTHDTEAERWLCLIFNMCCVFVSVMWLAVDLLNAKAYTGCFIVDQPKLTGRFLVWLPFKKLRLCFTKIEYFFITELQLLACYLLFSGKQIFKNSKLISIDNIKYPNLLSLKIGNF